MNEYILSIVIPHYNIPEMLEKLLDSIPKRDDIQVIVVDDNSTLNTDKLDEVIKSNSDRKLEFCRNHTGKNSAGTCRNIGIEKAKGKWIVFADSDDYFVDGWVEKLEPFFDSDKEMVYYPQTSIFLDTGELATRHVFFAEIVSDYCDNPNHENEIRLRYGAPAALIAMFSREYLTRIGASFDNTLTEEDKKFIFACGDNLKKFACISEPVYCVTARSDSLTATKNFEKFDRHQRVQIKRCGILYRKLSKADIKALGLENVGLQIMYTTIMNGYGIKQAFVYHKLEKEEKVPLMLEFKPLVLIKQLIRSLWKRIMKK